MLCQLSLHRLQQAGVNGAYEPPVALMLLTGTLQSGGSWCMLPFSVA